VAAGLTWIVIFMGLAVAGFCFFLPREIGKEDRPLVDVKVDMERIEDLAFRVQQATQRRMAERRARVAQRRETVAARAMAAAMAPPPPTPIRPEPPSAMGAPQPVLTDETLPALTLPEANGFGAFNGGESGFL
jgi:hypothetical protein